MTYSLFSGLHCFPDTLSKLDVCFSDICASCLASINNQIELGELDSRPSEFPSNEDVNQQLCVFLNELLSENVNVDALANTLSVVASGSGKEQGFTDNLDDIGANLFLFRLFICEIIIEGSINL